ncbi:MAG: hypothetical protein MJ200_00975 [Mycoplasmoidaceae bacterium]|nr:hypothetical protein [Mycoplasmoidaceae bacterium]
MKLNLKMAYAVAYVLYKKHKAKIADVGELENHFYVDFECKDAISISDFKKLENEITQFIYDKNNTVEIKRKQVEVVRDCPCMKKNKYLHYHVIHHDMRTINMIKINDEFPFVNKLEDKNVAFNEIKSFKLENVAGNY